MTNVLELRLGVQVWVNGSSWEVVGLSGAEVVLRSGETLQRMTIAELGARNSAMATATSDPDPAALVLSSLTAKQRGELEKRAEQVRRVLTTVGGDAAPLKTILRAKAEELGV